jgi:AraC-like DNA-binding protein
MQLDILLRASGVSLLLLTGAVLALSTPRAVVTRGFVGLALGIAGFLGVNTAFDAAELPEPLWSVASFLSRMAAVLLWLFCLTLFEGLHGVSRVAFAVGGAWLALVVIDKGYFSPPPAGFDTSAVQIVLGIGLVLHAGWRVLRDLRDDLVESRRRARPVFALALLALLATDFAVDLQQGYGWRPTGFLMLQNGFILVLTAGLALWLLCAEAWLGAGDASVVASRARADAASPAADPEPDPDAAVLSRIDAVMRAERPYLDPEITFAQFAAKVGVPEPALRRVINHRLGHGHFRSFLNEHRVEEAKRRLRAPASAGDKMLAVALDAGFASLASFNRVFRQVAGCTPSEYRARAVHGPHAAADGS